MAVCSIWMQAKRPGFTKSGEETSKIDERKVQTNETPIELAMIRLLVARHGRERRRLLPFSREWLTSCQRRDPGASHCTA